MLCVSASHNVPISLLSVSRVEVPYLVHVLGPSFKYQPLTALWSWQVRGENTSSMAKTRWICFLKHLPNTLNEQLSQDIPQLIYN